MLVLPTDWSFLQEFFIDGSVTRRDPGSQGDPGSLLVYLHVQLWVIG